MKAHIGVDSQSKLIHSVVATPANVHDSVVLGDLLHGNENCVWGDSAYSGKGDVIAEHAPRAKDFTNKKGSRHVTLSVRIARGIAVSRRCAPRGCSKFCVT